MPSDRVLVTGGAGFIGSRLAASLLAAGSSVTVLDDFSTGSLRNLDSSTGNERLTVVRGDVTASGDVSRSLRGVGSVVHLAAIASVPASIRDPERTGRVNVEGTRAVLEASAAAKLKKFVFASSCAVYGNAETFPISESAPVRPLSPYAASKLEGEELCGAYSKSFERGATALRFFNVYGPGQESSAYGTAIASMVERLKSGKSPEIHGDGLQTRDFVYVADVVDAILLGLKSSAGPDVCNIGSGSECSILALAKAIATILDKEEFRPKFVDPRPGDIRRSVADISRARSGLGYEPRFTLEAGLRDMLGRHSLS